MTCLLLSFVLIQQKHVPGIECYELKLECEPFWEGYMTILTIAIPSLTDTKTFFTLDPSLVTDEKPALLVIPCQLLFESLTKTSKPS